MEETSPVLYIILNPNPFVSIEIRFDIMTVHKGKFL
jgi:hypothetical protein